MFQNPRGEDQSFVLDAVLFIADRSSRWLIANGRKKEAERLLTRFHTAGDATHPLIQFEMAEITQTIELESLASETPWSALVKSPGNRKRTFIAVCVGAFAQWNVSLHIISVIAWLLFQLLTRY